MTIDELWVDRATAYLGTCFGGVVSMGVLVTAALVLQPQQVRIESMEQASLMLVPAFPKWGATLFGISLGIGCFGAAVEIALNAAYVTAQVGGWRWGANRPRRDIARSFMKVRTGAAVARNRAQLRHLLGGHTVKQRETD